MLVSLTVGKVDAGVAVLLTDDKRLIEFPSILLPAEITTGSVVDVKVSRNFDAEQKATSEFDNLQNEILSTFGSHEPQTPVLRCRNATQTSIVLEWDPISLATANLKSLTLYRNGAKAGVIPRPLEMTSTKISGLAVDTEYSFSLILRTTAGTYNSDKLIVKTHKMTDLSGITVTPGIMPDQLRTSLEGTIRKVGAKLIEQIRIDTTHFVCTEGRGPMFEKAREMNIPVVLPDWIKGCEREGKLVGVRAYYLDANPKDRQIGTGMAQQQPQPQQQRPIRSSTPEQSVTPTTNVIPPTPERIRDEREEDVRNEEVEGRKVLPTSDNEESGEEEDDESEADKEEEEEKHSDGGEEGDADEEEDDDEEQERTPNGKINKIMAEHDPFPEPSPADPISEANASQAKAKEDGELHEKFDEVAL